MASYSNDIKKDKAAAVDYLTQITYIDPTNEQAKKFIGILTAPPPARPARQPSGGGTSTKPKTGAATAKPSGASAGSK